MGIERARGRAAVARTSIREVLVMLCKAELTDCSAKGRTENMMFVANT